MTETYVPTTTDMVVKEMEAKTGLTGELSITDQARVDSLAAAINMDDSTDIIQFGSDCQKGLTAHADSMLQGVKGKDLGATGDVMANMMVQMRDIDVSSLNPDEEPNFFQKVLRLATPIQKFALKYEGATGQIEAMVGKLQGDQVVLLRDIKSLDVMYDEALTFFDDLAFYIRAGNQKVADLNDNVIPQMAQDAEAIEDESQKMKALNEVQDMRGKADDLERRVHDMKLTRQVVMQLIPQTRMIQQTDKGLCTKIDSIINNTIPLWKIQMAQAVTVFNQAKAAKNIELVTEGTNEMMRTLSDSTRDANKTAREQMEKGIVSIETVKYCHENLIAQIEESIEIAQAGKQHRKESDAVMAQCESKLADTLKKAAAAQ